MALCVALERPDLFTALILSAPSVEINAGLFLVRIIHHRHLYVCGARLVM